MPERCVSSDTSFYICLSQDLPREPWLVAVASLYSFCLGNRILSELPIKLRKNESLMSKIKIIHYDYYELVKPFFGREAQHQQDGEYEAIGIGYHLEELGVLAYLILDDARARKFVLRFFPSLQKKMVGTLGFLRDSCCVDHKISPMDALSILEEIRQNVKDRDRARPCGMDTRNYKEILVPIINEINRKAGFSA